MSELETIRQLCLDEESSVEKGLGWTLHSVDGMLLCINRYKLLEDLRIYVFQN